MTTSPDAVAYVYENIGAGYGTSLMPVVHDPAAYVYENVGILNIPLEYPVAYVYLDVTTDVPMPHIWSLVPSSGRPGDGFSIIGHGFGAPQGQYTGHLEIDLQDGSGWQTVGVVNWALVAASANMYTPARVITDTVVDPEHGVIEVLVPGGALPPGLLVRVVTNA